MFVLFSVCSSAQQGVIVPTDLEFIYFNYSSRKFIIIFLKGIEKSKNPLTVLYSEHEVVRNGIQNFGDGYAQKLQKLFVIRGKLLKNSL